MAEIALAKHGKDLVKGERPPLELPHPDWRDEVKAAGALRDSGKTRIFFRPRVKP
jgi:hypothetical protein